ncbi:MAG: cell division protein FtsQ/DivIB, partial [Candidatus Saccharimonadales bacterium]
MSYRKHHIGPKIRHLKRKRKPLFRRPWFWTLILAVLVGLGFGYWALFSRATAAADIQVSGNKEVSTQSIMAAAQQSVRTQLFRLGPIAIFSNSIFLVNSGNVYVSVMRVSPLIAGVTVQKHLSHTVTIAVRERSAAATFCSSNNQCFDIDSTGVVFEPLSEAPQGAMIIRQDAGTTGVTVGQNALSSVIMSAIAQVQKNLADNFQITVNDVLVSDNLVFDTSEGWKAYVDPKTSIPVQLNKLDTLLQGQIPQDARKHLQYIYLQYPDRAYY